MSHRNLIFLFKSFKSVMDASIGVSYHHQSSRFHQVKIILHEKAFFHTRVMFAFFIPFGTQS
jgi:hypothetical protein